MGLSRWLVPRKALLDLAASPSTLSEHLLRAHPAQRMGMSSRTGGLPRASMQHPRPVGKASAHVSPDLLSPCSSPHLRRQRLRSLLRPNT